MTALAADATVAVIGAGAMGAGIAQVAAQAGHRVLLYDIKPGVAAEALRTTAAALDKLVAKGRVTRERRDGVVGRLAACDDLAALAPARLAIEAVTEDLAVKREVFAQLEQILGEDAILASNTSSLSITAIAAAARRPARLAGMHFFNPAPLMPLVEVVSGLATDPQVAAVLSDTARAWGKTPVLARSTPGFIVNRVARPYYAEALRLLAEGAADAATIDAVMRDAGGFRMGPFELMDLIGHDVNYAVTSAVFEAYYHDPRYQPSLIQKELVEAGRLGRKSGRGFFDYGEGAVAPAPTVLPAAPVPARVVVEGHLGVAEPLVGLIEKAGLPVGRFDGSGAIVLPDAVLKLTDGRCATRRAADEGIGHLVLFDLALDYAAAGRIAIAAADQAAPAALAAAAGLFQALGKQVSRLDDAPGLAVMRTVAMLANEAATAVQAGVATPADIDSAMTRGLSYPVGPLAWAETIGLAHVLRVLDGLAGWYGEDRYRAAPLLRRKVVAGSRFHG